MASLVFDGTAHRLSLKSEDGTILGSWEAYNNVDSHATLIHVQDGTYAILDRRVPRRHAASANGPYGLHGIVRFHVSGHPGIGVHSGRASAAHWPGPQHPTMGCIRTTDEAMRVIVDAMRQSPLTVIEVTRNSRGATQAVPSRHRGSHVRHRHG